ncbi:arylsulfatase [Algibacter amylolyticus]|uniref:Arylsulfatase n=1 Tax=Algibacter amylolyticus TaxID=1608400 RepID=A0A5M7B5H6_9FLAO|nr:arylsulfatase [Algibacter amylolyticus]KAA5824803.1 arylsulfatase [Algibacter amylolyticus]MBB5268921.1 arylsulfatase A-like enzyme [Algibacter amylolyticus]TSJ75968.1 arylsulfatase [Algibacter amylolyticus]
MKKLAIILFAIVFVACKSDNKTTTATTNEATINKQPNIVIIYLDDLGYGDLGVYGAKGIKTPNIDKLANEGVKFTNGYATSATCTPSRYGLLTGVYPWRNKDAKILPGTAPLIIDTAQITIPKMLKENGYYTGVVGKWHLGLGTGLVDWNKKVTPGPNEVGFDYSYIMAATQDRVPTVYIDNGFVANLDPKDPIKVNYDKNFEGEPTGKENPELLRMKWHHGHNSSIINGIPRIGYMKGGESAKWIDEDMADHFLVKAQEYVEAHKEEPFFLYYAMQQPHVPRTPNPRFIGASGLGPRGDVIVEADWAVGEFIKTLEEKGILENTLIILSSDNGPVLNDGYFDDAVEKLGEHDPKGGLRGGKYSLLEAGTRVPFITYWKGKIEPTVSDALVSQLDVLASIAELTNIEVNTTDSQNILSTLLGKSERGRGNLVIEATTRTAYREGNWVMIPPYKGKAINELVNIEVGNSKDYQLYNLKDDVSQQNNLAKLNPEKIKDMVANFESIRGTDYKNVEVLELK